MAAEIEGSVRTDEPAQYRAGNGAAVDVAAGGDIADGALIGAGQRTDGLERDARVGGHVDIRQVEVAHDAGGADDAEQPDIVGGRVVRRDGQVAMV